jgi:hypothetical protein
MRRLVGVAIVVCLAAATVVAQRGGPPGAAAPARTPPFGPAQGAPSGSRGAQQMAPFDPAGYWVALVSDEWRYRMLTPAKGNVDYVPVNAEGRNVANAWDPAKDEANGEQCRAYGAGGIMRLPIRLHITWADERTLRMDVDAGTQTRVLHFAAGPGGAQASAPANTENSWQGYSVAEWQGPGFGGGGFGAGRGGPPPRFGQLKIVTTHLRPGYLRKNGVPYGAGAVLTEYIAHLADDDGLEYLAITSFLEDSQYLAQPWVRTSQFKKQADAKGWNPTPCLAR